MSIDMFPCYYTITKDIFKKIYQEEFYHMNKKIIKWFIVVEYFNNHNCREWTPEITLIF